MSLHIHADIGRGGKLLVSRFAKDVFAFETEEQLEKLNLYNRLLFAEQALKAQGKKISVDIKQMGRLLALPLKELEYRLFTYGFELLMPDTEHEENQRILYLFNPLY
ncbi:MAG: hypothetical protein ACOXZ4_01260 [Sphaerochaetaceae bacterium]